MKLRNKKTGEIGNFKPYGDDERIWVWIGDKSNPEYRYRTLAELNEEWQDYEEPKGNWTIDPMNENYIDDGKYTAPDELERYEELGLRFNTKEQAEKAVEKLKAWKRLSENKYLFKRFITLLYSLNANCREYDEYLEDIELLFGGDE
jgi:hypothetical protein